ncbi:MAG TPA: secondary thiamine-phosphate synthase enzyme YjbQ [Thermodesulfobacteriota bacterium]|nr:secondary thiamine-phosphate synthase enzyme YjbQ [Thermodesulfobacteriota bacterium]
MSWFQKSISLSPKPRGFHIVTKEILEQTPELSKIKVGLAHIFICHTSASLTLNENVSPDVLTDFESSFNNLVKENEPYYTHTIEGSDDMPAHIKSSLLGNSLTLPITNGRFNLGTWQGIYICEHRNRGGSRKLIVTVNGKTDEW